MFVDGAKIGIAADDPWLICLVAANARRVNIAGITFPRSTGAFSPTPYKKRVEQREIRGGNKTATRRDSRGARKTAQRNRHRISRSRALVSIPDFDFQGRSTLPEANASTLRGNGQMVRGLAIPPRAESEYSRRFAPRALERKASRAPPLVPLRWEMHRGKSSRAGRPSPQTAREMRFRRGAFPKLSHSSAQNSNYAALRGRIRIGDALYLDERDNASSHGITDQSCGINLPFYSLHYAESSSPLRRRGRKLENEARISLDCVNEQPRRE